MSKCPGDHPFYFNEGADCCKYPNEINDGTVDQTCDGGQLWPESKTVWYVRRVIDTFKLELSLIYEATLSLTHTRTHTLSFSSLSVAVPWESQSLARTAKMGATTPGERTGLRQQQVSKDIKWWFQNPDKISYC